MVNIKISELPLAGTISGGELIPIVQDGTTKQTTLSSVNGIPSTAKLYFPDVEGILNDIFYILQNEPISATDSVWGNFVSPRVSDASSLGVDIERFYNKGIYEENDYNNGTDVRNIGYSGVINTGAFNGPSEPDDYSGTNYYFIADFTDDTYSTLDGSVILSVKSDAEISYDFEAAAPIIGTSFYVQNIPSTNVAISFNVIVDNSVSPVSATYSLQVFGSPN